MAIVTTDDKYYTEIANAIREKALLYDDAYDLADTLDLGYDENWQPITKIPPP